MTRVQSNGDVANAHQQSILAGLQHRLAAATARGDMTLISQLEREMQQVKAGSTRGHSSVSAAMAGQRSPSRDTSSTHRQNLLANLQRRVEVAKAKGEQALVAQLERELQQLR